MGAEHRLGHRPLQQSICAGLLVLAAFTGAAQNPTLKTRTKEERDRQYAAARRIILNVQVTDAAGKPVTDLDAKDFTLFDNHQPRRLSAFHTIDGEAMNDATEIIIVLDAVNSPTPALEAEKNGIFKYLAQSHSALPYPTSFFLWSNGRLKGAGATTDRNTVGRAFVSITKNVRSNACEPVAASVMEAAGNGNARTHGDNDGTPPTADDTNCPQVHFKDSLAALDGIALQQLNRGGRTILIWVGPGWPLPSEAEFAQLSPKARRNYFDEIVNVLHDLRAAQITVDVIGPGDLKHVDEKAIVIPQVPTSATSPENARPDSLALPILAQQSGGQVIASNDIAIDLGKLLDDADWYYSLSFFPPPAQNGVELRSLEVKVSRPGLKVRTMTTYYSEP